MDNSYENAGARLLIDIALLYFIGAWLLDFPLPNWNVDIFKGLF